MIIIPPHDSQSQNRGDQSMGRHTNMAPYSFHLTPTPTGKRWIPTSNPPTHLSSPPPLRLNWMKCATYYFWLYVLCASI